MATEEPAHVEGKTEKERISGKKEYNLAEFSFPPLPSFSLDFLSYYVSSLLFVCSFCLIVCLFFYLQVSTVSSEASQADRSTGDILTPLLLSLTEMFTQWSRTSFTFWRKVLFETIASGDTRTF